MADIDVLGIKFELRGMEDGIRNLEKMDKVTDEVQATLKQLKKALEDIGKASNESYKDQVGAVQKLAAAKKQLEEASKKQAEAEVARAKARKLDASIDEKALDGKVRRENAYAKAIDQAAQREQALQKQKAQTAAAEELANERRQKAAHWEQKRLDTSSLLAAQESRLTNQNLVALERLNTYKLNQMSMIETRQLKANASIEQGAARLALQQEKFEYQKQRAAERAANGSVSAWQKFKDTMSTISDVTVGGFGIGMVVDKLSGVVKAADEMVLLDGRLKLATKSSEQFAQAQYNLQKSSVDAGLSLAAQTASYTQIERSTRGLGLGVKELSFLTESFGKAAVVSGADAESFKSAITQLNQGFASGVVRGQEFNSVAEQAPAIMEALANGMRGSNKEFDELEKKGLLGVAALRKMAGEGKLVNSVTIPALMRGLQETNKQFEQMPLTVERAFTMLSNKYKIWIADQNEATGATSVLAKSIKDLAGNFDNVVNTFLLGAGAIATVISGKLISSFVAARTESVQTFIQTAKVTRDAAAASVLWADATQNGVVQARKQLEVVSKIPGNVTAVKKATIELAEAENRHKQALDNKAAALDRVKNGYTVAGAAAKSFNAVLGAFGGWVGVAITAIGYLVTEWYRLGDAGEQAAKRIQSAASKIQEALYNGNYVLAENTRKTVFSQYEAASAQLANLRKQENELLKQMQARGATQDSLVNPALSRREGGVTFAEQLQALQVQKNALSQVVEASQQEIAKIDKSTNAFFADQALNKIKVDVVTPDTSKTKKTPLPDETLGSDAALRNLERGLSLRQSAVEEEKRLLGYVKQESLEALSATETRKLSLQQQQERQKLSEESKKKMTAEARIQHNEVVSNLAKQEAQERAQLKLKQERRALDNEEAKTKIQLTALTKAEINEAKYQYAIAKEQSKVELASLDMAERMGDIRASVASERKKEVEISLQLQKNQVDMAKALADERITQAAYNLAKENAATLGKEEVEQRRQAHEAAEDAVEAVKQENAALKEQLDLEKKLSILRTDGLSGAKKAISDYIDGLDNWYQTGYNIANESINLLEDAFVSFIETGKLSGAKLFKYLRDEFKKLAVQRIIIQPIMNGASSIISSLGSTFSGNFAGAANIGSVLSGLSGVGSMIGGGLSGAAFNGAQAFATSGVGQWLGLSETTAEVGTIMTEAGTQLATAADAISTYGGYAKAAYDVFNAFKEGTGWGAAAGSAIGAYFGGAPGAFIGNKIGGFVDKTFSGGGGQKVGGEGAVGMSNLGLFPEGQTDALVQDALVSYQASLKDVAKKFGVSLDNMSVAYGYETDPQGDAGNFFSSKAYLNGASIREVTAQKYEGEVVDQMAKEFKTITVLALSGAGLKEDFQAAFEGFDVKNVTEESVNKVLARLDTITVVVNAFDTLSATFPKLSGLSIGAKESIVELAGGLEALTSKLSTYFENFYTEEEQVKAKTALLAKEFEKIGIVMPNTREAFRSLVEAQDLNTEAGRKTYTSLLNVAGAFAEVIPAGTNVVALLQSVKDVFKSFEGMFPVFAGLKDFAKNIIVDIAGGVGEFSSKVNSYFENFYSAEEKAAVAFTPLKSAFDDLGVSVPKTRQEFRSLVEAQDLTTETGAKTYAALLNVVEAFAKLVPASVSAEEVLSVFSSFSKVFPSLNALSLSAKSAVVDLAGGVSNLSSAFASYYENFLTSGEKSNIQMSKLADDFAALGVAMPKTRQEFVKLVNAQDANTSAGKQMLVSLLKLADAFAQAVPSIEDAEKAVDTLLDTMKDNVSNALSALFESIEAEQQKLKDAYDKSTQATTTFYENVKTSAQTSYDEQLKVLEGREEAIKQTLESITDAHEAALAPLEKAVDSLGDLFDFLSTKTEELAKASTKAERQAGIQRLAAIYSSVSSGAGIGGFAEEIKAILPRLTDNNNGQDLYSSFEEWSIDQARTAAATSLLKENAGAQLSTAEQQLELTKAGFDSTVLALEAEQKAIEVAKQSLSDKLEAQLKQADLALSVELEQSKSSYELAYQTLEQQKADAQRLVDSVFGVATNVMSVRDAVISLTNAIAVYTTNIAASSGSGVAVAAVDGSHADGLPYVPFDGYTAQLHKGERVLTKAEAEQYGKGDEETRNLIRELIEICKQTTRNTFYIEKKLDNWDGNGLPDTRAV